MITVIFRQLVASALNSTFCILIMLSIIFCLDDAATVRSAEVTSGEQP